MKGEEREEKRGWRKINDMRKDLKKKLGEEDKGSEL